jgi:hypothetical protein
MTTAEQHDDLDGSFPVVYHGVRRRWFLAILSGMERLW